MTAKKFKKGDLRRLRRRSAAILARARHQKAFSTSHSALATSRRRLFANSAPTARLPCFEIRKRLTVTADRACSFCLATEFLSGGHERRRTFLAGRRFCAVTTSLISRASPRRRRSFLIHRVPTGKRCGRLLRESACVGRIRSASPHASTNVPEKESRAPRRRAGRASRGAWLQAQAHALETTTYLGAALFSPPHRTRANTGSVLLLAIARLIRFLAAKVIKRELAERSDSFRSIPSDA
jgi:hypothetical protein